MARVPDVVDRYIAWAWHEGKVRKQATEVSYRRAVRDLAASSVVPLEEMSEEDLREYQYALRLMGAGTWNVRASAIAGFFGYLSSQVGRADDPSDVLKRRPKATRQAKDPVHLEVLISAADPETRAVAQLIRETGWTLPEVLRIDEKPDRIPPRLRVMGSRDVEKEVTVTPTIRDALQQLDGRITGGQRTWEGRLRRAGLRGPDLQKAGPSRSLSLDALHHRISLEVRQQILVGDPELAAFAAYREIEIRVRELAKAPNSMIGVGLMTHAFRIGGALADPTMDPGEQEAIMSLFRGAIGTFKNPSSHRRVQFADASFAREVLLLADLLHRMLDDIARSLGLDSA